MKQRTKKLPILLSALLFALATGLFAGCDSSGSGKQGPDSPDIATKQPLYFYEDFDSGVPGSMTMYTGLFPWESAPYGAPEPCAKISAYQSGTCYADEGWLITPLMDFSAASTPELTFTEMVRFAGSFGSDPDGTIFYSTDYSGPGDPNLATWTKLRAYGRDDNSNNYDFRDVIVDLAPLAGESAVYVAFRYSSTAGYAATWEIDNVLIGDNPSPRIRYYGPDEQTRYYGPGATKSDTIRLSTTRMTPSAPANIEVQGYNLTGDITARILGSRRTFRVPPKNIPASGGTISVNLRRIAPAGTHDAYILLMSGTASTMVPVQGRVYPAGGAASFSTDFSNFSSGLPADFSGFTLYDAGDPPGNTWVNASYGDNPPCAKMSAYSCGAQTDEDWLITPPIDVAALASKQLTFTEAINYAVDVDTECQVLWSDDYSGSGDPNVATWNTLAATPRASGSDWTFVSVTADLSSIPAPQTKVYIAFKYTSTAANACTWEIDDVDIR